MRGIDVSSHQGKIDWNTVKTSGIEFAVIRAGYGESTPDKWFKYNITEALRVGLKVGVYWFSYALNEEDAIKEADFCMETVKPYKLSFPIFYDFEYDTERYASERNVTYTRETRGAVIKAFCDRIKQHGFDSGIYTNQDYIKYKLNFDELSKYPLWLAAYGNEEQTEYCEMLKQTTSTGAIDGIAGNVDLNMCFVKETDNEPSEWSKDAVEWAVKNKILLGDEEGNYKLREACTTERFLTLLYRAIKNIKLDIGE